VSRGGSARVLAIGVLSTLCACSAIQTREHTRESYLSPDGSRTSVGRIFAAERDRVYQALFDWLLARSVEIEDADAAAGRIVADLRFGSDEAQEISVRMGSVRTVVTRTMRRYRTYWPFEAWCDACIIRRGNLISAETDLVSDRTVALSARSYEIAALLRALVTPVAEGTRVELDVGFEVRPRSPPGISPVSTGELEQAVFAALEQALDE
jgi:hypothetical protein